ncbi:hypothetical protein E4T56_gene74 [Termitomyces sp. T112]|nr:hypothetical protein E4T56_gene74 [Termitomyces sp. T112]
MRAQQLIQLDDALPLRRVLGQTLQTASGPQLLALGFQRFQIKIRHDASIMSPGLRPCGKPAVVLYERGPSLAYSGEMPPAGKGTYPFAIPILSALRHGDAAALTANLRHAELGSASMAHPFQQARPPHRSEITARSKRNSPADIATRHSASPPDPAHTDDGSAHRPRRHAARHKPPGHRRSRHRTSLHNPNAPGRALPSRPDPAHRDRPPSPSHKPHPACAHKQADCGSAAGSPPDPAPAPQHCASPDHWDHPPKHKSAPKPPPSPRMPPDTPSYSSFP